MAAVDNAVRRVLTLKETLGLFDRPFRSIDAKAQAANTATPAMRALSREAGRASPSCCCATTAACCPRRPRAGRSP